MRGLLIAVLTSVLLPRLLCAQEPTAAEGWDKIRAQQPATLHLKMILLKDHFFQGERIEAVLTFTNDNVGHPYSVAVGAGTPGAVFRAIDANGRQSVEPLQWLYDWFGVAITGPVGSNSFGSYTLKLPVNDTVRFDAPGTYSLYALASVTEGVELGNGHRVTLVSDQTKVVIVPLTPDQEKAVIDQALKKIASGDPGRDQVTRDGFADLGYLQTPAARDELIKVLGQPDMTYFVYDPLLSSRDPAAVAAQIHDQVHAGKLVLTDEGAEIYGLLKTAPMLLGVSPIGMPEKEVDQRMLDLRQARTTAQQEILAAAIAASGDHGHASIKALWSAFEEQAIHRNPGDPDSDGGKARAAVAARQLELSPAHVKRLLDAWNYWGSADSLPLMRRESGPPNNDFKALIALIGIAPEEARPRIIAEFKRPDCRFFERSYPSSTLLPAMPPMPLPQFDSLLRQKLAAANGDAFPIIPVICCFGSPALLPNVVEAYENFGRDIVEGNARTQHWDDAIKSCLFRYWLRSDPKSGKAALESEITARGKEGAGFLNMLILPGWTDDFLPALRWALSSSNEQLGAEGIYLLEKHGTAADIDPIITALEHQPNTAANMNYPAREASDLLKSTRWHFTDVQRHRLETLVSSAPAK